MLSILTGHFWQRERYVSTQSIGEGVCTRIAPHNNILEVVKAHAHTHTDTAEHRSAHCELPDAPVFIRVALVLHRPFERILGMDDAEGNFKMFTCANLIPLSNRVVVAVIVLPRCFPFPRTSNRYK